MAPPTSGDSYDKARLVQGNRWSTGSSARNVRHDGHHHGSVINRATDGASLGGVR